MHLQTFCYSTSEYDWAGEFTRLYGVNELEQIHKYLPNFKGFQGSNDSSTLLHKVFYANFDRHFKNLYESFLIHLVGIIGEDFYYQKIPCVRFGMPDATWLSEFHQDGQYNHPEQEININLAITKSSGSAALQIEKTPLSGNYVALEQDYGQFTFINHIMCRHGSIINKEAYTLISLDFRLIPLSKSADAFSSRVSVIAAKPFIPGGYFSTNTILSVGKDG